MPVVTDKLQDAGASDGERGSSGVAGCDGTNDENNYDEEHYDYIPPSEFVLNSGNGASGGDYGEPGGNGGLAENLSRMIAAYRGEYPLLVLGESGQLGTSVVIIEGMGGGPGEPGKKAVFQYINGQIPVGVCGRGGLPGKAVDSNGAEIIIIKGCGGIKGLIR